jgi:hypothetical protein
MLQQLQLLVAEHSGLAVEDRQAAEHEAVVDEGHSGIGTDDPVQDHRILRVDRMRAGI